MNKYQILFIIGIVIAVLTLIIISIIAIHGSWPNLTSMTAIPDCTKEIVGNCSIIK